MAGARRPRDPPKLTRARAAAGRRRQPAASPTQNPRVTLECEVLPGLEPFCGDELRRVLGRQVELAGGSGPGAVRFSWSGPLRALLGLRTAVAVYLLVSVPGRRPSTLLGDTTLFDQVETVRRLHRPGSFSSFRLSVPGRDSAALRRLRQELTARTGLGHDPDEGELYLRIRRSAGGDGWDLLTRLTPRPLSARGWRVARCSPSPTSSAVPALPAGGDAPLAARACGAGLPEGPSPGRPSAAPHGPTGRGLPTPLSRTRTATSPSRCAVMASTPGPGRCWRPWTPCACPPGRW